MPFIGKITKHYRLVGLAVIVGAIALWVLRPVVEGFHRTMTPHSAPENVVGNVSFCPMGNCPNGCAAPKVMDPSTCEKTLHKDASGRCHKRCGHVCLDVNSCTDNTCCSGCPRTMFPVDCVSGEPTPLSQQYASFNGKQVDGSPSYPVGMLAPNVAQYGRRLKVIHPSTLMRYEVFPSNYAAMHFSSSPLAANPEPSTEVEPDGMPVPPASRPCPTCRDPFPPNYKCRPSPTGMSTDCGPYGLNVGRYGDQLTGCNCPVAASPKT
jgi:hypothetical protein